LLLLAYPYGGRAKKRLASRIFVAILLTIMVCDVVISTFDGQQEARKHVLVSSIAALMIVIFGFFSVTGYLSNKTLSIKQDVKI